MKTYKWLNETIVQQFDEDGVCRISGLREAFPDDIVIEPADPVPAQPVIVSPRQIRQALNAQGLRQAVEGAISSGSQDLKDWWEFSLSVESNHPLVLGMAQTLGVTEQQLDDLFSLAATL